MGGKKKQPLNLQYAGKLVDMEKALQRSDWYRPIPLSPTTSLHWLMPKSGWSTLPVLPQFHDGRNEALLLVNRLPKLKSTNDFLALRFRPADVLLDNSVPLWVGTLTRMRVRRYFSLPALPRTEESVPSGLLCDDVHPLIIMLKKSPPENVLLIMEQKESGP